MRNGADGWLPGGYSALKEITREDFVRLVGAIEADELDVVIVRDVDRLTWNLTDWNRFEKACVQHGVGTLVSPRIAGLREWHGQKYPTTEWPAIVDPDTHEKLVRLFADPARRKHVVGRKYHLLSGLAPCPRCGHRLKYRMFPANCNRADSYACAQGPGGRCGGVAIKAELPEEYVTGVVLDALESPRVQQALRTTGDQDGPRRAEMLAAIKRAQDVRSNARRDLADGVIDREDRLDIRQRTEDQISVARRDYDRLTGSDTVLGDIPPADGVRQAWESWNTDRRRAAIKAVLHKIIVKPLPPGTPTTPGGI
jgi:site-specific DNA recombinase